jgi:hypothetical protein
VSQGNQPWIDHFLICLSVEGHIKSHSSRLSLGVTPINQPGFISFGLALPLFLLVNPSPINVDLYDFEACDFVLVADWGDRDATRCVAQVSRGSGDDQYCNR